MGFSKLDTLENRPGFIKKFVKSYGATENDILAADATETAASAKVAHQGWTISPGGNGNPSAMRETVVAMNIGSDIGTDDDAGLGIGGGGGESLEYTFGGGNGYYPMYNDNDPEAVVGGTPGRSFGIFNIDLGNGYSILDGRFSIGDVGYWISGTALAPATSAGNVDPASWSPNAANWDDGYNWSPTGGTGNSLNSIAQNDNRLNKIKIIGLNDMGGGYQQMLFAHLFDYTTLPGGVNDQWFSNYWSYAQGLYMEISWGFAKIL